MFQRLVALLFITAVLSEPECSRFHYEEQTLNRMIRQEIAMEKLQADMAATQQQVLDALGKLTETTKQLREEKIKLEHVANVSAEGTNKSVRNFSAAEIEKLKGPTVAFRSKDLVDKTPSAGDTLVFKTTTLNEGLGYDNKSGIFTAPVAGTYTFSVQLYVHPEHNMYYAIIADSVEINKGLFADKAYMKSYTAETVAVLQKDSKVYMKCSSGSGNLLTSDAAWNTFSGVLVHL
ncbi:uncharacterized protein LOC132740475 isoform X2 [Ruditapes philippinarum]|uniref:uncharacterized protein LOC132740475 isoform X2 n=1 Tax=Ruditapes philippinarum TaxID=129788 RepID=UPI00295B5A08|nr:uncharacterized protein LOC132740475 isoform X2 [Ruditapes philippinarum]